MKERMVMDGDKEDLGDMEKTLTRKFSVLIHILFQFHFVFSRRDTSKDRNK